MVVDVGHSLLIELENGAYVDAPLRKGFKLGTPCWVSYSFESNEVRHIFKDDPDLELKQDTSVAVEPQGEHGDDSDVVESDFLGSGALFPCSEGWEFWDSDSGVLELS